MIIPNLRLVSCTLLLYSPRQLDKSALANTATNILKLESRASSIPILENKEKIPTPQSESRAGSQGPSLTLKLKLNDANTTPVNKVS